MNQRVLARVWLSNCLVRTSALGTEESEKKWTFWLTEFELCVKEGHEAAHVY